MSVRLFGPLGQNTRLHPSHELSSVPSPCALRTRGTANCFKQSDGVFLVCVPGPSDPCGGVDSVFVLFGIPDYTRNTFLWRVLQAVTPLGWQLRF